MRSILLIAILATGLNCFSQTHQYKHCNCLEKYENNTYTLQIDGMTLEEGKVIKGKREGQWITNNIDGNIIIKANYKNDLLDGEYIQYFENGNTKAVAHFKNGRPDGVWFVYNNKGKILREGSYQNGKPAAIWTMYDMKGKRETAQYNFETGEQTMKNKDKRLIDKYDLVQDDMSKEWILVFFPERNIESNLQPLGGYITANDLFIDNIVLPFQFMNTYVHREYIANVEVKEGETNFKLKSVDKTVKDYIPSQPSFPYLVITNDEELLDRVEFTSLSLWLLKKRIQDQVQLSGPWINFGNEDASIELQIPVVVNDIANRPM